ncbi:fungal-specific transcription factor domain-containing protein [Russula earlei]|uniref:Fungal-specific transcription factor domain-containing protein n=1 Tax=Russula earlei TaxID=71964 RepID=A0ACC0ULD5_9AGAM|nr:fungal-specific transcription factor domain-containing protein [Russula earlei]
MSSAEEDINPSETNASRSAKKRRVQRACDVCRRKKIRCDGSQMPGNKCSNCAAYNFDCKYEEAAKKRGPPKGYVESLESRLEKMETLLQRLCPDADFTQELGAPIDRQSFVRESLFRTLQNKPGTASYRPSSQLRAGALTSLDDSGDHELEPSDDECANTTSKLKSLQDTFNDLSVSYRFFGKSSGANLVQTALDLKSEYNGTEQEYMRLRMADRRPEFWTQHSWERTASRTDGPRYSFPEPDLIDHLVDLFFSRINLLLPLLHRPTFERQLRDGLHLHDQAFASVLLCLCACASRYSDDPRVLLEGCTAWHSSGWKWFAQVQMLRRSLMGPPLLHDVQLCALACLFLQGCSSPQSCWTMIGIGIRLVQDVGRHRKRVYNSKDSAEAEQWRRAFWVLVVLDRQMSASLGRPCAIQEEDFDVDLPKEVDDEYWENEHEPEQAFKQPAGKPSLLAFFVSLIKLIQILAVALRTIYSINKSKIFLGFVGPHWEQHIVAELDSALNEWIDTVPGHLKWDTTGQNFKDLRWFLQSACLYSHYYHLQILVHRPFIPSPRKPSPLSFPSLAICTNAARSCAHVVDLQRRRAPKYPSTHFQLPAFTAGIVLLLNIWGAKRSGNVTDPAREMEDVHKCMAVLQAAEGRWHAAGRLWDVLYELASVGDLPLPLPSPSSAKRERDSDSPVSLQSSTSASTGSGPPLPQPQRVSVSPGTSSLGGGSSGTPFVDRLYSHPSEAYAPQPPTDILSHPPQPQNFAYAHLPTHSDELARVPGHVFQPSPEAWLAPPPPQAHSHRHQHQHQHTPLYAPPPAAGHQQTSYGTPPNVEGYTTFVAPQPPPMGGPPAPGQGVQDGGGNVDIWHTVPSGYECVPFPFYSGAGGAHVVGDWLIGGGSGLLSLG